MTDALAPRLWQLVETWREKAERHGKHGVSYRIGQGWGLGEAADELTAALREAEGAQPEQRTECCDAVFSPEQRFCPKCGYEFRAGEAEARVPPAAKRGHIDPDCEVVRGVGWMCTCGVGWMCTCETPEEKAERQRERDECE